MQTIQSEKGLVQPEWYQVCAQLRQGNEDVAYYMGNDYKPVPPTVLKILTEQCGYTFVTPEDFRGNMTRPPSWSSTAARRTPPTKPTCPPCKGC